MATFTKLPLSASLYGQQILIVGVASASATAIHTAPPTTASIDEVWLYAYNDSTASLLTSINWGYGTEPANVSRATVGSQAGRILLVDGKLIQNGNTVYAYASASNVVSVDGFVNRITT